MLARTTQPNKQHTNGVRPPRSRRPSDQAVTHTSRYAKARRRVKNACQQKILQQKKKEKNHATTGRRTGRRQPAAVRNKLVCRTDNRCSLFTAQRSTGPARSLLLRRRGAARRLLPSWCRRICPGHLGAPTPVVSVRPRGDKSDRHCCQRRREAGCRGGDAPSEWGASARFWRPPNAVFLSRARLHLTDGADLPDDLGETGPEVW